MFLYERREALVKINIHITGASGNTWVPAEDQLAQMKIPSEDGHHRLQEAHLVKKGLVEVVVDEFQEAA